MFTPKPHIPPTAEADRLYNRLKLVSGTTEYDLFPSNASGGDKEQNYESVPLSTDKNTVFLGLSIDPLLKIIQTSANVDPAQVINTLSDGIIKISTNQRRTVELRYPIKDVINFNNMGVAADFDSVDALTTMASLSSTGMRPIDQLFFVRPNESWSATLEFNNDGFPAEADWPNGPFGVYAEIPVARMTDDELNAYAQKLGRDAGYPKGNFKVGKVV